MADITQKTRYDEAQTVSDEHGKGSEILRQAVAQIFQESSNAGSISITLHVLDVEVDIILRNIRIMTVDVPDANADLTTYRNRAGTLTALHTAVAVDTLTTEIFSTVTLTVSKDSVRKNDSIYAIYIRDAGSTEQGDVGLYVGWMPDLYRQGSNFHTY